MIRSIMKQNRRHSESISPFYTISLWLKAKNSFKDFVVDDQPGDKGEELHCES